MVHAGALREQLVSSGREMGSTGVLHYEPSNAASACVRLPTLPFAGSRWFVWAFVSAFLVSVVLPVLASQYQQAVAAFQQGHYSQAIKLLETLPPSEAAQPASQNLRALALCELKRYDEALDASRRACEGDPGNPNYVYNAGLILIAQKDGLGAEKLFRDGLVRFPKAANLHAGLAESLFLQFQFPQAEAMFQKALSFAPESAPVHVGLAKLFYSVGNREKFGPASARAIASDPSSYLANYYYGLWLSEYENDPATAAQYFEKCNQIYPGFAPAWGALAKILANQGRWQQAAEKYEKALALDGQNREYYFQVANAYRRLGQAEKAARAMKQFKDLEAASQPGQRGSVKD